MPDNASRKLDMNLFRKLSLWYVIAIPILAGTSSFELPIGGFNYTGYIWVAMLPLGLFLLAMNRMSGDFPGGKCLSWVWLAWCGYVFLSLMWGEDLGIHYVQQALQLCMPIAVALIAASAVRTTQELRLIYVAFGIALALLVAFTCAYVTDYFDKEWMSTHLRSAALSATLIGCIFLALFPRHRFIPILFWGICLLITTVTSSRIATIALLMAPILHPYSGGFGRTLLRRVVVSSTIALLGVALFYSAPFQVHFFETGEGTLNDLAKGDIKDMGRAEAWAGVWEEAWKRPLFGAGVGSVFEFVPYVWDGVNEVHNDYLRVFFELGFVGLGLFVLAWALQLLRLHRQIIDLADGLTRSAYIGAWLGSCALLVSCLTDNTIIYHMTYTNPLFALIGAAYGVAWASKPTSEASAIENGMSDPWAAIAKRNSRSTGGFPHSRMGRLETT